VNTLENIEELSRRWERKERKKKEEKWSCIAMLRSSMNHNGKFWNFWPNFIHLKIFFFLFSRLSLLNLFLLFMCPFIHHWRKAMEEGYKISWLCICAILSSLFSHTISFIFFVHSDHFANIAEEWNQLPTIFNT